MTREEAIKIFNTLLLFGRYDCPKEEIEECFNMAIKALEQEPCEDEYIKVPKKALKYRTAGMVAYNAEWLKNHFDIERAVICGEQEPCEDCISRQIISDYVGSHIQEINTGDGDLNKHTNEILRMIVDYIGSMPPVTPQPKTGHWITHIKSDRRGDYWPTNPKCSVCGGEPYYSNTIYNYKFCPYCGAKMEKER